MNFEVNENEKLRDFIEKIKTKLNLSGPAISGGKGDLYVPKPPSLEEKHRFKLDLTFKELKDRGLILGTEAEEY